MCERALECLFTVALAFLIGLPVWAQSSHPFELPQPPDAPERLLAIIEIPEGSRVKYEIDPIHGGLLVDRFLPDTHRYPANYGGLPSVWAADGDLLDVLVISPVPLVPGALIEVSVIGLAKMLDGGEQDHKVIVRPISLGVDDGVDVEMTNVLPAEQTHAIESFFKSYKASLGQDNPIQWLGFGSSVEAKALIQELLEKKVLAETQNPARVHRQPINDSAR